MLAVSALRSPKNEREGEMEVGLSMEESEFPDLSGSNLLESIDFDDLFLGMEVLPDLEMDPHEMFSSVDESEDQVRVPSISPAVINDHEELQNTIYQQVPVSDDSSSPDMIMSSGKKINHESADHKPRKSMPHSKNPHSKRKVKVDWTPELHRRFVQAVEQLGVDKAVPSRILELMGIDCLTRHNIASHLQKYRSHRKHLMAREAEAASWSQRRQLYGKRDQLSPWTMGFPPVTPPPLPLPLTMPHHLVRPLPLHVWGHPSVDQSIMPIWPKHLNPHAWPPPADPSFWNSHNHHVPMPGTPCFPQPARFPSPAPVPGTYKVGEQGGLGFHTLVSRQTLPQPPSDIHPSKESVDAAIGDVLSKPWLPLPLGLKPPSVDGVMVELQRQGISNVPPSCA